MVSLRKEVIVMNLKLSSACLMAAVALMGISFDSTANAGCNCQGGGGGTISSAPIPAQMGPPMGMAMQSDYYSSSAMMGHSASYMGMHSGMVAPPPGTIGQTYQLPSRPVPADKHPRVGMIDIRVTGATKIVMHDMNAFRTENELEGFQSAQDANMWHFESKPLIPGISHIYRIEAQYGNGATQERYVRLIQGRLVHINF